MSADNTRESCGPGDVVIAAVAIGSTFTASIRLVGRAAVRMGGAVPGCEAGKIGCNLLTTPHEMTILALGGQSCSRQGLVTLSRILTMFNQAQSRGIRARHQAVIREAGEQGRAAVLDC